jgi:hypothetical protein
MDTTSDSTTGSSNEPDIDPDFSYAHRRKIQRLESTYNPAADEPSGSHIDPGYSAFAFDQPKSPSPQADDMSNSTATQVSSVPESSRAHTNAANPICSDSETNPEAPQPSNGTNSTVTATQVAERTSSPPASSFSAWLHAPRPRWVPKYGPA